MRIITFILLFSSQVFAGSTECVDKAMYLHVGLKLTQHMLYMVEDMNEKGETVEVACGKKHRLKAWNAEYDRFMAPLTQARIDIDERGITTSKNFHYFRKGMGDMVRDPQICKLMETHLTSKQKCLEPEDYQRGLIDKKMITEEFPVNCMKYLDAVHKRVAECKAKGMLFK